MNDSTAGLISPADPHNLKLLANAHPGDWVNPRPAPRYNMVMLGGGTAGLVAAAGAAGLGAKVALIERHLMGGDCLNYGCVPSKALLRSAKAFADLRDAAALGVTVPSGATVDFPKVMERMRRLRAQISPNDSASRFKALGVDVFLGEARFTDMDVVEVGGAKLRFARAVIATGARAAAPKIPGIEEAGYLTNETVFSLTELPRRLAVLGAGPIGCELAQAFARFGSKVFLVNTHAHVLPREDADAAAIVERALLKDGIEILASCKTLKASRRGAAKVLQIESEGKPRELEVDAILAGVGRAPNVEGLGLDAAGVEVDAHGIAVNDSLRTTNPSIFAAGGGCAGVKVTHNLVFHGAMRNQKALFMGRKRASALLIPWCTYTDPEIAHVGLYAEQAREKGIEVRTFTQSLADVDRAILDGEEEGFVKVHVRVGSDEIVGATIVARHAGDMISELTVAMTGKVGLGRIASAIHPYPTQAEAIRRLGDQYNRTRLTPFVKKLFSRWLAWSRR